MTKFSVKSLVVSGLVLSILGFSAFAFAHGMGYGYGGGYGMMNGSGYHHMGGGYGMMGGYGAYGMMNGYGHMGWAGRNTLSAEDQKKVQAEMDKFFESTKDLRAAYSQKRIDLDQAYANPEKNKALIAGLEKALFDLSSQLEKKRFEHITAMRDILPDSENQRGYHHCGYGMGGYGGGCF